MVLSLICQKDRAPDRTPEARGRAIKILMTYEEKEEYFIIMIHQRNFVSSKPGLTDTPFSRRLGGLKEEGNREKEREKSGKGSICTVPSEDDDEGRVCLFPETCWPFSVFSAAANLVILMPPNRAICKPLDWPA